MTNEECQRFHDEMEHRLANLQDELVFAAGACFQFALRLHERFGFEIRGIREGYYGGLNHVWCRAPNGRCIDIRGINSEEDTVKLANCGKPAPIYEISVAEIVDKIVEKQWPPELAKRILDRADFVFDTHQKFSAVRPLQE